MGKSSKLQTGTVILPQGSNVTRMKILYDLLINSSMDGNLTDVQKWINQGATNVNVDIHFEGGVATLTPLVATLMGKFLNKNDQNEDFFKVFKLLIENDADVDKTVWMDEEKKFHPPISLAIRYGYYEFVEYLIEKGAKLDFRYRDNTNILFIAVSKNRLEIAKLILGHKQIRSKINIKGKQSGLSVLHIAVSKNYVEMAKLLIDHGANVNSTGPYSSESILHTACWNDICNLELVEVLVKNGANLECKSHFKNDNGEVLDGFTPLFIAVKKKNVLLAKFLLEHGANVKAKLKSKKEMWYTTTPLHFLLLDLQTENIAAFLILKLLIKHGADIETPDSQFWYTPLHFMSGVGYIDGTKLLLRLGANMRALDKTGRTPFELALEKGHLEVVQIMIDTGYDAQCPSSHNSESHKIAPKYTKIILK